jgi:hypothetical protein
VDHLADDGCELIDQGPDGPVQAVLSWIEGLREIGGLEGWPEFIRGGRFGTLTHRRVLDDGDEVVVVVPLEPTRIIASEPTDWLPARTGAVNLRVRQTDDGWQVIGDVPFAR